MKVNGTATLNAPRDAVWVALNDPAVLVRTIPGCQQLEEVGPDAYRMTLTAGVASIKGTYTGDVALTDQEQPGAFTLRATGAGAPGTVQADVRVTLADAGDGTTRLDYDADAVVGGMIGGVGQRVLTGVAKKTAGEFFRAVDDVLAGKAPAGPSLPSPREEAAHSTAAPGAAVFTAPASGPTVAGSEFVRGAVFGAVVALAGVLVGAVVARRRA
jgi:carbon monoxide dehydrogenase subunit G